MRVRSCRMHVYLAREELSENCSPAAVIFKECSKTHISLLYNNIWCYLYYRIVNATYDFNTIFARFNDSQQGSDQ